MLECASEAPPLVARPRAKTATAMTDLDEARSPHPMVALTGFMGCGKSTTGRELAQLLGWEFVDLDETIRRQERFSIREVFSQRGEAAFRAIEHRALQACLAEHSKPTILALGGGAFVQANNAELLASCKVVTVFLDVPVEELLRRCAGEDEREGENPRPLAVDSASFRRLYEERLPAYRRADLTVSTGGKKPSEAAREIAAKLGMP